MANRKKPTRQPREHDEVLRADVTVHLPGWMLDRIRLVANNCSVPCEDVIQIWVAEKILSREKARLLLKRDGH